VVRLDERDLGVELVVEGLQKFVRRGVDGGQLGELLLRRLGRVNQLGNPRKLGLVLVQVGVSTISSYASALENVSAP
jgi:hypothetical protein